MIAQALLASTAIILLSFISEDAATISSALSIFGGPVNWPLGFAACFAGIWLGDLGLYSLARWLRKPILRSCWVARFADAAAIERCQEKFNRGGSLALLASRFVPGTRLPTYLAAGLLSMPLARFAVMTAFAAFLWIGGIFVIAKLFGAQALFWFSFFQGKIAATAFTAILLGVTLLLFKKLGHPPVWMRRWAHWEFWPAWLFYIPVGAYYLCLAIRYRGFGLPTSANPGMATGGFIGESKYEILQQLQQADADLVANAYLIEGVTTTDRLLSLHRLCRERKIKLPFIFKPDIGQRGNGVRLIHSFREAFEYLSEVEAPVILQRYAAGPYEVGVFYYRLPGEAHGQIFSITEKLFQTIIGDGVRTVAQLILADPRASLISKTYLRRFAERKHEILPEGEVLKLVETGNHAQGCIFRDGGHIWSKAMEERIDNISRNLPGFYIGRYDIRYHNQQEFTDGRNFKIVELNGASSEATSIYDARTSLRSAYRVLFRQWRLVFAIGAANQARGCAPDSVRKLWREWRHYSRLAVSYPQGS